MGHNNLSPTREDVIYQKFLALEAWAHKGGIALLSDDKRKRALKSCKKVIEELNVIINTPESRGKELGWWG